MKKVANRVAQADLTNVLVQAAELETQRIEALTGETVDQIDGGAATTTTTGTTTSIDQMIKIGGIGDATVGYYPQQPTTMAD